MSSDAPPDRVAEAQRLAEGWRLSIQVFERIRRQESGKPLLRLSKD